MMKLVRYAACVAVASMLTLTGGASALTVLVDEDFEGYASQGAFEAAWPARAGDGFSAPPTAGGNLVLAGAGVADQQGNAATGAQGLINEDAGGWHPVDNPTGYELIPSATENIVMRGDIFIDAENGPTHRQGIGLRGDIWDRNPDPGVTDFGTNFIEMGTWNGSVCLPTAPDCEIGDPGADPPVEPDENAVIENDFAFRVVLFDSSTLGDYWVNGVNLGAMQASPNWQYFRFDDALDLSTTVFPNGNAGNEDGDVDLGDFGDAWHTFETVITETTVELSVDLFRDGINNATGGSGPDATVVVEIEMAPNFNTSPFDRDPAPMTSFRFGSPSGVTSDPGVATFDNLYLALEDVVAGLDGDYNNDGTVDAADYTLYRDTLGDSVTNPGDGADGNNNGVIDPGDYTVWANNYGSSASASSAIPEPAALVLVLAGLAPLASRRR